jgi:nitroreductase
MKMICNVSIQALAVPILLAAVILSCLVFAGSVWSDTPDALSVIHSRKSVRSYTDEEVTKEQLIQLMEAAMAAPTAMDKRPWRFVAVTERETLDSLGEGLPYAKMLFDAPAAIVVCGDTTVYEPFWMLDCSCASENLLLAAEAMGLGAVWTAVWPRDDRQEHVREVLELPDHILALNVIPIGYPAGNPTPKEKFDETNIHWEKW